MKMTPVASSNLKAVGYDKDNKIIFVEFKGGKTFSYENVSEKTYADFMNAESIGRFFNSVIKRDHKATEVPAVVE